MLGDGIFWQRRSVYFITRELCKARSGFWKISIMIAIYYVLDISGDKGWTNWCRCHYVNVILVNIFHKHMYHLIKVQGQIIEPTFTAWNPLVYCKWMKGFKQKWNNQNFAPWTQELWEASSSFASSWFVLFSYRTNLRIFDCHFVKPCLALAKLLRHRRVKYGLFHYYKEAFKCEIWSVVKRPRWGLTRVAAKPCLHQAISARSRTRFG